MKHEHEPWRYFLPPMLLECLAGIGSFRSNASDRPFVIDDHVYATDGSICARTPMQERWRDPSWPECVRGTNPDSEKVNTDKVLKAFAPLVEIRPYDGMPAVYTRPEKKSFYCDNDECAESVVAEYGRPVMIHRGSEVAVMSSIYMRKLYMHRALLWMPSQCMPGAGVDRHPTPTPFYFRCDAQGTHPAVDGLVMPMNGSDPSVCLNYEQLKGITNGNEARLG